MIQYLRVKIFKHEPFSLFRNSPIYWDEIILMPLPFLSDFLVTLTEANRNEGLSEIEFVSSKRPFQRKAASSALSEITIKDLGRFESIEEIADASGNVRALSTFESSLSKEFGTAGRNIDDISADAKSYLEKSSNYNKLRTLSVLGSDVDKFKETLIATKGPVGYKFLPVAETWSQIIKEKTNKLTELKKDTYKEIPNPYIFGNPVRPEEKSRLFVGRRDIIREIESNLANISQKPTLFLHGRRRVGKSSVLINLPRFLGKRYVSAYIDCQDARTTESPASFCYTLSKSISNSLKDRGFSIENPPFAGCPTFTQQPIEFIQKYKDLKNAFFLTECTFIARLFSNCKNTT
jgi:AAA+ ATPase superfamily predicted ATPase